MEKIASRKKMSKLQKSNVVKGYLFLLPNLLGFLVFVLVPVVSAFVISFTDWNAFSTPNFIGLDNFKKMMDDPYFWTSLKNNLIYTLIYVPATILLALVFALAINHKIRGKGVFRTVYYLPYITSMVAVAMVWRLLFNTQYGPINNFLLSLGMNNPPGWLTDPNWALYSIIIMCVWKNFGYYMVILMAGLAGIPQHLYEAANIDGANAWQKFKNVTWPMLSPTMFFVTITCVISSFKVFDAINIMTQGGPGRSTYVLVYTIYREAFTNYDFGYASSVALILFILIFAVTLVQWRGQKKWVEYM